MIPLNPRTHPVKLFVVSPVYVITSSSIFNKPYWFGNPLVLETEIISLLTSISADKVVDPITTSGVRLSTFRYWSKFSREKSKI